MVVEPKKNGKLCICLDPMDLNRALQRENYPMPTTEEVVSRLHGAKVCRSLDVSNGFWRIVLDEESSFCTTFNTPFGRYRWKRMPFGIRSTPEVFQRKMHELIEGLRGVEVIADDSVVVGYGELWQSAIKDHDRNLLSFLQRCDERGVHLNSDKLQLRMKEVPFIGHVATGEGLRVDPSKVRAIREMPPPENVAGVQRILGMSQYLSKFLPRLSDITKPLRDLTRQDAEWIWDELQQSAFECLKQAVSATPVLRYYNLKEDVTIQCDASQRGLKSIPVSCFRVLEEVDHRANLPVSDERWQQLTHVLADDPVLKQLHTVIQCGWPERKSDVPMCLRPYFDLREELVVQGNLIFKGPCLVVPVCMRKELMSMAHATHIGIEGCLRRVRECLFWPMKNLTSFERCSNQ